ncbi:hypothetical protein STRTUCAR8_04263 [Streptomyces turgidiscabies Car8]|uniref:Uncharacterized protein n=1 Tax=Streptomyces turgidiscabies (strain Car8) TaxID=698760 RepID=L7FEU2_STRT8|nr:hypothetical protein STRTUCAR8_04263 [Streptomyces turgidiscabies Car8]
MPGARRRRRHESSPHTRVITCLSVPCVCSAPLGLHKRISKGPLPPRHPHSIDMEVCPSGCMMPPSASVHERGPIPAPAQPVPPPIAANPQHPAPRVLRRSA